MSVRAAGAQTRTATATVLGRRDGRVAFGLATVRFLLAYLCPVVHLPPGLRPLDVTVVADPLGTLLRPSLGPFSFEPIARVSAGPVTYLASFNTAIGFGLATLVGLNLAMTFHAVVHPRACGIGRSSTGLLAGLPALLSGTACCGPVVLIVLGIQASGVLLTAFQFLLPLAALLLVGSLVVVARQIDPQALAAG